MHPFLAELKKRPLLADGAMGTMLYAKGVSSEQCLEYLVIAKPQWITEIHQAYATAGVDLLKTHTFGANRIRLANYGLKEKVRDLNFRAVRLARDVREVAGRSIFIAGDIGPLGMQLEPNGQLTDAEAEEAFREQAGVLWEAGCDVLLFETFSDVRELDLAVRAARSICDLPIIASMTFASEEPSMVSQMAQSAVRLLRSTGAAVIGVNCSMGPAQMLQALQAMHAVVFDAVFSVMPNAGLPERIEGRFCYRSSPEYFARHVSHFLAHGARIIGGCCGTTPAHIRAMRIALDAQTGVDAGETSVCAVTIVDDGESPPADYGVKEEEQPTELLRKLRQGAFIVSVEIDPPRGFNPAKQIEGARYAKKAGADVVNVADSPMARVRMSALALCVQIQQQEKIETVLHFTTRDRSLMGLQADLIGARSLGIRNILALTGDPPSLGDNRQSKPVFDLDSIGLVRLIKHYNEGRDLAGQDMGARAGFTVAVACDPTRDNLLQEVDRLHQKAGAGAHLVFTQPIFDPALWIRFVKTYEERHGPFPLPALIGILPLHGHRHATFLHHEVPGITLSEQALERMRKAGANGRQEGVKMAQELLEELKGQPYVQGVYLMPSFGRYELACEVLDILDLQSKAGKDSKSHDGKWNTA